MAIKDDKPVWIMAGLLLLLIVGHRWSATIKGSFILNKSSSIPKGIYRIVPLAKPYIGELIVFNLPKPAELILSPRPWLVTNLPLIKPIYAMNGDRICVNRAEILINNQRIASVYSSDYLGQPIPVKTGCYTVLTDQVLPISTYNDRSFDGRYFGPIDIKDIIGEAIPILTW